MSRDRKRTRVAHQEGEAGDSTTGTRNNWSDPPSASKMVGQVRSASRGGDEARAWRVLARERACISCRCRTTSVRTSQRLVTSIIDRILAVNVSSDVSVHMTRRWPPRRARAACRP